MKRFFIILLLGLSCQLSGYAQSDTLKISRIITDSSTGEQVSFASVHVCDTPIWVHSDQSGAYSITLPAICYALLMNVILLTYVYFIRRKQK